MKGKKFCRRGKNGFKRFSATFLLVCILCITGFTVENVLAIGWEERFVYDEINDSLLNWSIWENSSSGTPSNFTTLENTDYFQINGQERDASSTGWVNFYINSTNLPNYVEIENLTVRIYLFARVVDPDSATVARSILNVFGNEIRFIERNWTDTGSLSDTSTWFFERNQSAGIGVFNVYDDGTLNRTITATSNLLSFNSRYRDNTADTVQSTVRTFFVYLTHNNETLDITLNTPADNIGVSENVDVVFNITTNTSINSLDNVSLYINDVFNDSVGLSGTSDEGIFTVDIDVGNYNWSVFVCDDDNNCRFSETRFFNVQQFNVSSQDFSNSTFETSTETFRVNISYNSSNFISVSGDLVYNGTTHTASQVGTGDNIEFTSTIDIDLLSGGSAENKTFFWRFFFTNIGGTVNATTDNNTQQVNPINLASCGGSTNYTSFNYTVWDESEQTILSDWSFGGSFSYFIGGGTVVKNSTVSQGSTNETLVCINQHTNFTVDSVIEISLGGFETRTFSFNDEDFNNVSQQRRFYLINSSESTNIIIQFVDQGLQPLEGLFVTVQRFFPSTNSFLNVTSETTDEFGQFVASLVENTVDYRFIARNGSNDIVKETDRITVACRTTICVLQFVVEDVTDDFERFENVTGFTSTLSFDNNTNIFTVGWSDITGDTPVFRLLVQRVLFNGTTVVCNSTSTSSASSLTCDVGGSTASYRAQFFRGSRRISVLNVKVGEVFRTFGREGLFWGFMIAFTALAIGSYNPTISLILYSAVTIGLGMIGIISFNIPIFFSTIIILVVFIWAFRG
jgi:hypothetical protein